MSTGGSSTAGRTPRTPFAEIENWIEPLPASDAVKPGLRPLPRGEQGDRPGGGPLSTRSARRTRELPVESRGGDPHGHSAPAGAVVGAVFRPHEALLAPGALRRCPSALAAGGVVAHAPLEQAGRPHGLASDPQDT